MSLQLGNQDGMPSCPSLKVVLVSKSCKVKLGILIVRGGKSSFYQSISVLSLFFPSYNSLSSNPDTQCSCSKHEYPAVHSLTIPRLFIK